MKKTSGILIVIILMFSFMVLASGGKPCTAGDPPNLADAYQQALGFLAGAQNADGSWGTMPERDTALAAEALASSGNADYQGNIDLASAWYSQMPAHNLDVLARKIWLGSVTGSPMVTDDEQNLLLYCFNPDGGMCLAPYYPSTLIDTALGIYAIPREDTSSVKDRVSFLISHQDQSGGFGLRTGSAPDFFASVSAYKALTYARFLFQTSDSSLIDARLLGAISKADTYLAQAQHLDGGFGEQASTAYDTALVLEATSWSTSSSIDVMAAASFLLNHQQTDGSISGDEATTAMFCAAAGAKPYLPTSALSFVPDSIPENSPLKGNIKIGNMGLLPTGPFELNVALDNPDNTLTTLTVEDVPPCGLITLPFEISLPAPRGIHDVYVSIAGDFNKDTNLYDNYATGSFNVEAGCNFALISCASSPAIPSSSEYLELQARVRNTGEKGAGPVGVCFYEGSDLIGTTYVTWLGANEDATATLPDVIIAGGDHAITAVLDEAGDYSETSEADNRLDFTVRVAYDLTIPELASPEDGALLGTKTPTLSWYPSTGAGNISYILEVSSDPGSGSWSRFDGIPQAADLVSAQMPNPLGEGTIWWRVRATDGLKETDPSRTRSFTTDTLPPRVTFIPAETITFSPNSDGLSDQAQLQVDLGERASIVAEIVDADGLTVKTLCDGMSVEAGRFDLTWDGTDESGNILEGSFKARVTATDSVGNTASYDSPALISDITPLELTDLTCTPDIFSPNGDGILDTASIHATLSEGCIVSVSLVNQAGFDMGPVYGPVRVGSSGFDYVWNGRAGGHLLADGAYTLEAKLQDQAGFSSTSSVPVTLDTSPPTLSSPNVSLEASEVKVEIESGGAQTVVAHFQGAAQELACENGTYKGSFARPAEAGSYPIYVVSTDAAGNAVSSDTFAVLISTFDYSRSWVQTSGGDFWAGEEKNGTDVGTRPGNVILSLAQEPATISSCVRYVSDMQYGFHHANAIVGADGRIYMAGGMTSMQWWPFKILQNTMYIYDPATDSYSYGASMNGPGRITCSVQGNDGKIYCFGGFRNALSDVVEVYDPVADSWETRNPLPYKLGLEAGALGPDGCIYIFGGWIRWGEEGIPDERTTAVLRYDPHTDTYSQVTEMPNDEHRCCLYAVTLNDKIYLMGGHTDTEEICNTVWEYDAIANTFTSCPDVPPASEYSSAAYAFGRVPVACPLEGSIYFIGGWEGWMGKVQRYDPASRNWTNMPDALDGAEHRVVACIGNKLYIFGGHLDLGYLTEISLPRAEVYSVGYQQEGYFVSQKQRFYRGAAIGDVLLSGVLPPGSSAAVSMRYSSDGNDWSDWTEDITAPGGTPDLPASDVCWIQYRLKMLTENTYSTPVISEVSVSYNSSPYECQFRYTPWLDRISPTGTIGDNTPTFRWWGCADDEHDPLTATLELDRDPSMNGPEKRVYSGLPAPASYSEVAHFTMPDDQPLADGTWYYRVRCTDGMSYGRAVEPETFTVDTTPPTLLSSTGTPNPFSPDADGVDDSWSLAASCDIPANGTLNIYNDQGNLIKKYTEVSSNLATEHLFTWNGRNTAGDLCPPGRYSWELSLRGSLGNTSSPYTGTVDIVYPNGSPWQLVLAGPVAEPARLVLVDTGGDLPQAAITFSIDDPATVSAGIYHRYGSMEETTKTYYVQEPLEAGEYTLTWDGMRNSTTCVQGGEYEFRISAVNGSGSKAAGSATIQVESNYKVVEEWSLSNDRISPNDDGNLDSTTLSLSLAQAANVSVEVKKDGTAVKELAGPEFLLPGTHSYNWDGTDAAGNICADGEYQIIVDVRTRHGMGGGYYSYCSVDARPPGLEACLLDRVPGYPDRFILTACFDDTPASSTLLTGGHNISLAPAGEKNMSAEITLGELSDPGNLMVRVSDDLGNTAEYGFVAHLPAPDTPYEKVMTSAEDFGRGTLQRADAQTYPGFLTTNAAINPDWLQLGDSPVSFPTNTKACMVDGVTYMFGYQQSNGHGGWIYPVWAYDNPTDNWSIVAYAPADFSYLAATVLNSKIYLVGINVLDQSWSPEAWCFDPATSTFAAVTAPPQALVYHTAVSQAGYMYVFGGLTLGTDDSGNPSLVNNSRVYRYDPASNSWEDFCSAPPCVQFSMSEFLSGSMYIRAISASDGIYVFNAAQTEEQMLDTSPRPIFRFDPTQQSFEKVGESGLTPGLALDPAGHIFLLGQCERDPNSQNDGNTRIFDTSSGQMNEGPTLPYFNLSAFDQSGIRLFGAGGNGYSVFVHNFDSQGHFTSEVIDLGGDCRLGMLSWLATSDPGAEISCAIRTSEDGATWSDWSEGSQDNMDLTGLQARYVQVRTDFSKNTGVSTTLAELRLGYENNGTVFTPDCPDLRVDGISFEPVSPEAGDDVQVSVAFSNQGAPAIAPVLRLYQEADQVGSDVVPLMLAPGASQEATFTYKATEEGSVTFEAIVDPDGSIVESNEENNVLSASLEVQPSGIQAAVLTDKASYGPEEDVSVTSTIKNDSDRDRSLYTETYVEDASGNYVDCLDSRYIDPLAPGEELTFTSSWNTGLIYSGNYRVRVSVTEDWVEKATPTAPFTIEPEGSLALSATCDRISYSAGDAATFNARLISEASNFCFSGLTVRGEVLSPEGSVIYSSVKDCPSLYPGDLTDVPFAYQVGNSPAGTYTFRATALNGSDEVTSIETTFEVESTLTTGAGISGMLSATPRRMEQGTPYVLDYTVENQGNCGLSGLPAWLLVVDPQTGEAVDSRTLSLNLAQDASAQGNEGFNSSALTGTANGKYYLAVLIVQTGESSKTLGFTTLQVGQHVMDHIIISEIASPQEAGAPFTLSATAYDAQGNLAAGCNEACTLTDATGTVEPQTASFTSGVLNAQITVTKTTVADTVAISTGDITATTNSFEIVAGAADHLTTEAVASPQVAGTPFAVSATAYDAWGNLASGFNEVCAITDATGTLEPQTAAFTAGVLNAQITVTKATESDTVTISTGGLGVATNSFEVVAGAADHLTTEPVASPQVAGTPFTLSATAYDAWGNPAAGFNGSCTISDTTGMVAPTSAIFTSGVLNAQITVTKATASDTVTITAGGLTATTNAFEVLAGPADHLTVEAISSPQVAGTPFGLTAYAWDIYNNSASGFNAACTITDTTGALTPQMASFAGGTLNAQLTATKAIASDTVTITASGLTATSNAFAVTAAAANHLTVSAIASPQTAGTPFGLTAYAWDTYNNPATAFFAACTITDATGTVTPHTASFAGGTLNAQLTVTKATASDTVTITAGGLAVTSNAFAVAAAAANHLTISTVASPQTAGAPFAVSATAYDAYNNSVSGLNAACTITDATGTVTPTSATFASGVLSANLTVTKATASDTVTITAGGLTATSNAFAVTAVAANHLTVSAIASPQTAGAPFAVSATAYDAQGNLASDFNAACTITDTTGTLTPQTASFAGGTLNAQLTVTKATASDTVTITAGGLTATSNSFAVTAAAANHLTVSTVASPQTAGTPFGLTAYAWDAYNNPASGFNGICTITDATGTVTPHTASFTGGTLSVQATVTQAIASDTITISASGMNVSSNAFEVKSPAPAINIDLSLSIENQTAVPSVLVWTDGDANEALITEVLTASGYNYTIVRADHDGNWHGDGDHNNYGCGNDNGNDNGNGHCHQEGGVDNFAAEMRSGAYNVFMLLSPDHPLEDGLADELRELVNAGAGLLVSDPANVQHFKEHPSRQGVIDLFGIKQKGNMASGNYTANLTSSVLSPACTLAFTGKMDKLEIDDAQTLGTVTIRRGNKTETWPALTLKQYGRGKATLAAFDFAQVAQADRGKAKTILNRALDALCAPGYQPDAGSLLPLRLNLTNHGAAVSVKAEIPLPAGVTFLWAQGGTFNQGKVVFTLPLASGETRVLRMLMVPQQTGTYTVTASLYYQQAGTWTLLKQGSATASVAKNAASLKTDLLAAISALSVASRDRHYRDQVYGRVAQLNLSEQNPGEVEEDIEDLTGAADDLQRISSADTTAARLLLDRLLIQLQIRWYTLAGGGNR